MIASLGMYDRAETAQANDNLWALIRDRLRAKGHQAPDTLTRGYGAYWTAWEAPDLVFSQTCGFPYRARLHGTVTLIGTPDYGVAGCPPGHYCSVFVARTDDDRDHLCDFSRTAFAFNEGLSQSGWAAPQNHAALHGITLPPAVRTGGHLLSAKAVADGRADIAALDAVTWAMLQRWEPLTNSLREVARTAPTPGLPYIAATGVDSGMMFTLVGAAIADLEPGDRDLLMLRGLIRIPGADYLAVATPPSPEQIALAI